MRGKKVSENIHNIGWGIFLIFAGIIWLLPAGTLPDGAFYIGIGVLILGLNLIKYLKGFHVSWIMPVLGILILVKGIGEMTELSISILGVLILLMGLGILINSFKKS